MTTSTIYRKPVPSPFHQIQQLQKKAFDVRNEKHPVREEVQKHIGTRNLVAVIEEDAQTLSAMDHVDGLIAFLCTLQENGRVISQGRGSAVLGPNNRYISRAVTSALNSSFADAAIRCSKVLGTFHANSAAKETRETLHEAYSVKERAFEPATEKQRQYLWQLVQVQVDSENERDGWEAKITEMSKNEASDMIASFAK